MGDAYLDGLPEPERSRLAAVNAPGLARLGEYLESGEAIAFVGAGASAPLYPVWSDLVSELVDDATSRMTESEAATCRAFAATSPEDVVELVRQRLRPELYRGVLRRVFRLRGDLDTGRTWTPTHELVARCNFRGVVTTSYDPGIVDARMRVRAAAGSTGYCSWSDETAVDGWRTEDVFRGDDELPGALRPRAAQPARGDRARDDGVPPRVRQQAATRSRQARRLGPARVDRLQLR